MDLLKTLPIGLYLEEPETWLHRLDSRVKLVWLGSLLISPILANAPWRFGLVGFLILLTLLAWIPLRVWRQQMGWLLALCTFMLVLTLVLPDGLAVSYQPRLPSPETLASLDPAPEILVTATTDDLPPGGYRYVLFHQGPVRVTQQSLELGIRLSTLFFTLIYGTNLFLLTTASEEITVALETLMGPLRLLRVPVTEIALTVTLALRFIPLVLEEVQNLVRSVQTRAIQWKKLGFRGSVQVGLAVVEQLLNNLLLRAAQTAAAMQVRGFTSPNTHRVEWYRLRLRGQDWLALGLLGVFWWGRWVVGGE